METVNAVKPSIGTRTQNLKKEAREKFDTARNGAITLAKNFNFVKDTSAGMIRGGVEGAAAVSLIGLIGKNIKESKGQIGTCVTGIMKDTGKAVVKTLGFIPSLITKAPIKNLENVLNIPVKFYGKYLKGNPITAFAATMAGLGIFAFRAIQGKLTANVHNANIDHATITGHAKVQQNSLETFVQKNKEVK